MLKIEAVLNVKCKTLSWGSTHTLFQKSYICLKSWKIILSCFWFTIKLYYYAVRDTPVVYV